METLDMGDHDLARRAWLRRQLLDIGTQRYQAAAILLASPVLWRKVGPYLSVRAPWNLDEVGRASRAWSSGERCLWCLAQSLIQTSPTDTSFVEGLSNLDPENASYVVTAVAVACGSLEKREALDGLGLA